MENINQYIDQKYIDFKFPLLKSAEEEVKEIKNKIAARGALGGSLISGPYRIRKDYIDRLFLERVSLEINIRKEFGIKVSDDEYNNIVKNILRMIEHEYNFLINTTREDANLARMDKSTFENSFLKKIQADLNSLKETIKRKMEIGKFELDKITKFSSNTKPQIYDAFLCHASEDKEEIANSLFLELKNKGKKIWYDDFVLKLGDSLRQKIDEGLEYSNYGIVILSKNFFNKNWPRIELDGLFDKETSLGRKVILPIWHKITKEEVQQQSHILAGRFSAKTSEGLDIVVKRILEVINNDKTADISDAITLTNEKRYLPIENIKSSSKIEKLIFLFSKSSSFIEAGESTIALFRFEDEFTKDDILKIADIALNNYQIFNSYSARRILESFFKRNSDIIPFDKIKKFFNNK